MKSTTITNKIVCFLCIVLHVSLAFAQDKDKLLDAYDGYTQPPREVAYLHLNKSTYIKGEDIGFTAYVFDKKNKKSSKLTTNLYVSIEDKNENTIAKKLLRLTNGVASSTFDIDSTFTSGFYTIKAYTNWMRNFDEQNYYVESIRIIDPEREEFISKEITDNTLDAQFLPESGHLLNGVVNTIGVIVKDNLGYGVPNIVGTVLGQDNEVLTSFNTNEFGIGKFPLLADIQTTYSINFNHGNKDFSFNLNQNIEKRGIIISLNRYKSKIFVSLMTNAESLDDIKNKKYSLLLHNGDNYNLMDINFTDDITLTKAIEFADASPGINILTLFNEHDQPIAERLFFNYEGLNIIKSDKISVSKKKDSVAVTINFKNIDAEGFTNISVSVLPDETKSYNKQHNMVSYVFLQPYVKGEIEQGAYYFTDIDAKKQFELDNLLITQGWSSYNWDAIFEEQFKQNYAFEQGIRFIANINSEYKDVKNSYLMHAMGEAEPQFFNLDQNDKNFRIDNIFPTEKSRLFFSRIKDNSNLVPAELYVQSFPNAIPKLSTQSTYLNPKFDYNINSSGDNTIQFEKLNGTQLLDEVTVTASIDNTRTRTQKLGEHKYGKIKVIKDLDRLSFNTLTDYLQFFGLTVNEMGGGFIVTKGYSGLKNNSTANYSSVDNRTGNAPIETGLSGPDRIKPMTIFLDDIQLVDSSFLNQYPLSNVDYIEINSTGMGEGSRGGVGVIKIYSGFGSVTQVDTKTVQQVSMPLVFSSQKKFYVPKYQYYTDNFYKQYGTIDWKPNLVLDKNGTVNFTIANPKVPVTLFIEGIANDGSFIFEQKTMSLH